MSAILLMVICCRPFVWGPIGDCNAYTNLHPRLGRAFEFLRRPDLAKLPVGRYEIETNNVWAMVQELELTPFGEVQHPEIHGTFIDIQVPLDGPETYGLYDTVGKSFKKSSGSAFLGELPPTVDPTIDGEPVEPGKVFEKATSAKPIVYPDDVTLTGEPGAQTVVFGDTETSVPAHYTATLGSDGRTVTLALNANAMPRIEDDGESEPLVVGEGKVRIHITNAIPTLWYALGWGENLGGAWNTNDYVKGAADFEDEPPDGTPQRFYNVLTTDAPTD